MSNKKYIHTLVHYDSEFYVDWFYNPGPINQYNTIQRELEDQVLMYQKHWEIQSELYFSRDGLYERSYDLIKHLLED